MGFTDWLDDLPAEQYAVLVFAVALISVLTLELFGAMYVGRDPDMLNALGVGAAFGIIFGGGYYIMQRR